MTKNGKFSGTIRFGRFAFERSRFLPAESRHRIINRVVISLFLDGCLSITFIDAIRGTCYEAITSLIALPLSQVQIERVNRSFMNFKTNKIFSSFIIFSLARKKRKLFLLWFFLLSADDSAMSYSPQAQSFLFGKKIVMINKQLLMRAIISMTVKIVGYLEFCRNKISLFLIIIASIQPVEIILCRCHISIVWWKIRVWISLFSCQWIELQSLINLSDFLLRSSPAIISDCRIRTSSQSPARGKSRIRNSIFMLWQNGSMYVMSRFLFIYD